MNNKNNKPSLSMSYAGTDYVALTDICQPKQWKTIPKAELKATGYPVYGANGIIGYSDEYNHENKTILIACRGASCGAVNVCLPKSYVTGNAMCLDNLSEEFDLDFLQHYLQTYDFKKAISGSAQPQITRSGLNSVMVPILPTSLQRRISHVLNAVDKNKKQTEQAINYLDSLIKSRFIEMFGDPIENPKGWRRSSLKEVAPAKGDQVPDKGTVWSLGLDAVEAGTGIILRKDIAKADSLKSSNIGFSACHVLYSKLRPYLNKVVLPEEIGVCTTELLPLLPNQSELNRTYLCYLLRSDSFVSFISGHTNGAKMPRADMNILNSFGVPIPPLTLQQEFADFVAQVDKLRFAAQQQIDKLELLKKSLLQEYFN